MKFLKWIGITLGGLVGLLIVVVGILFAVGGSKYSKTYDVTPEEITIPNDAASIERGEYIYMSGCAGCHGDDASGTEFFADPALATIPAPNLTAGEGGVGSFYTDLDYVRSIRHGVRPNGEGLAIMPAQASWYYSDADLSAIIAYLKSVPPVEKTWESRSFGPMGKILTAAGVFDIVAAENLDHDGQRPAVPPRGATAEYGAYLANIGDCRLCHGEALSGGRGPEPGAPPGPNLTPGGELVGWSAEDFVTTIRTGISPHGHELDPNFMPWKGYARLDDDDLTAIYLYLQSLSALETTTE